MKWGLALGSLAVTYLLLEFVGFRFFLPYLPLKLHVYLPKGIGILAQPSKRSMIPREYIALVGDSYARGYGEWFPGSNPGRNQGFHSANLIYRATGRDVVTFGAPGAGSLTGLVSAPIGQFRYINASWPHSLTPPGVILVYFYSGNDFNNNLRDLKLRFHPNFPGKEVKDREVFRDFLTTVVLGRDAVWADAERSLSFTARLFFLRTLDAVWADAERSLRQFFLRTPGRIERGDPTTSWPRHRVISGVNRVIVGGNSIALPDRLQSPGLELGDEEISLGAWVFEEALRYLQGYFSSSSVRVIYIPSPLECYNITSSEVDIETYEGRRARYRVEDLEYHRRLAVGAIQKATERNGLVFLDATPYLKRAAQSELIHGPKDWWHFNRAGYEALVRAVLTVL
jgi:hypothetical protein